MANLLASGPAKRKGRPKKTVGEKPTKPVAIAPGYLAPYHGFMSGLQSTLCVPSYYTAPPQPGKRHYYVPEDVEVVFTQGGKPIAPPPALAPAPPPARIPRAPNSFMLYRKHRCKEIAASNPSLDNNGVSLLLGKMWRNETPEVRESFVALAKEAKRVHQLMYPHYRYSPRLPKAKSPKKPTPAPHLDSNQFQDLFAGLPSCGVDPSLAGHQWPAAPSLGDPSLTNPFLDPYPFLIQPDATLYSLFSHFPDF